MLIALAVYAISCSNTHHPNSKFNEIAEDAKDTQSKPPILRLLNAAGYAGKTESWIKKLDRHINDFCVSANLNE